MRLARQLLTADMLSNRTPEIHQWALEQFSKFRSEGQFVPLGLGQDEKPTTDDIPAEVNRLILKVLAEIDLPTRSACWDMVQAPGYEDPRSGFKNGYVQARDEAILRYIKENQDKFRIRRSVMPRDGHAP